MLLEALLGAVAVMVVSLIGVVFSFGTARGWFEKNVSLLVSFAGGVFFVTAGGLAIEVFEIADSWFVGIGIIVIGYLAASTLHYIWPETHHHHGVECDHSHGRGAKRLIIGDAIHNVADGVVILVAFTASSALGSAVLLSIVIHEALQEVSEFFVLRRAGYSVKKALAINVAVSSTVLLGVGVGYLALVSHELEVVLLALSAGFFFHVVIHDLLPRRRTHGTGHEYWRHALIALSGVIVMAGVQAALGQSHQHGNEADHHEGEVAHSDAGEAEHHTESWWEHLFHSDH